MTPVQRRSAAARKAARVRAAVKQATWNGEATTPNRKPTCSRCDQINDRPAQRYCTACHAAYMREWRKTHPMSEAQRFKDNARSYANAYKQRGNIPRQPCAVCDSADSEMHHPDHEQPLVVTWLCRPCHLAWHSVSRVAVLELFSHWVSDFRSAIARKAEAA